MLLVRGSGHRHRGTFYNDVPYVAGGTSEQVFDLHLPVSRYGGAALLSPPYPLVMFCHGGGWATGNNNMGVNHVVRAMVNEGCAVASLNYTHSGTTGSWPQYIYDLKAAIRFLRGNAHRFLLDSARFALWGYSAGAHGAGMCALTANAAPRDAGMGYATVSEAVVAAALFACPVDFLSHDADYVTLGLTPVHTTCAPGSPEADLFWGSSNVTLHPCTGAGLTLSAEANLETKLSASSPALYLAHGGQDTTIPHLQSERLHTLALGLGLDSTRDYRSTLNHGTIISDTATLDAAKAWLRTKLAA